MMRAYRLAGIAALVFAVACSDRVQRMPGESDTPSDPVPTAPALAEADVDELPQRVSGPTVEYPDTLRKAGIEGRVVLAGVIGIDGSVEDNSVTVVTSTHEGFEAAAREWLESATFTPGLVQGEAVRVIIQVPIEFRLAAK
jgi:protein TonB